MKAIVYVAIAMMAGSNVCAAATGVELSAADSAAPGARAGTTHRAKGLVEAIDPAAKRITVKHGPVPSLQWAARTTTFAVLDGVSLAGIAVGNEVDLEFTPGEKGGYLITALSKSTTLDGRAQLDPSRLRSRQ